MIYNSFGKEGGLQDMSYFDEESTCDSPCCGLCEVAWDSLNEMLEGEHGVNKGPRIYFRTETTSTGDEVSKIWKKELG